MIAVVFWVTIEGSGTFTLVQGRWKKRKGGYVDLGSELEKQLDNKLRDLVGAKSNIFQKQVRQGDDKGDSL